METHLRQELLALKADKESFPTKERKAAAELAVGLKELKRQEVVAHKAIADEEKGLDEFRRERDKLRNVQQQLIKHKLAMDEEMDEQRAPFIPTSPLLPQHAWAAYITPTHAVDHHTSHTSPRPRAKSAAVQQSPPKISPVSRKSRMPKAPPPVETPQSQPTPPKSKRVRSKASELFRLRRLSLEKTKDFDVPPEGEQDLEHAVGSTAFAMQLRKRPKVIPGTDSDSGTPCAALGFSFTDAGPTSESPTPAGSGLSPRLPPSVAHRKVSDAPTSAGQSFGTVSRLESARGIATVPGAAPIVATELNPPKGPAREPLSPTEERDIASKRQSLGGRGARGRKVSMAPASLLREGDATGSPDAKGDASGIVGPVPPISIGTPKAQDDGSDVGSSCLASPIGEESLPLEDEAKNYRYTSGLSSGITLAEAVARSELRKIQEGHKKRRKRPAVRQTRVPRRVPSPPQRGRWNARPSPREAEPVRQGNDARKVGDSGGRRAPGTLKPPEKGVEEQGTTVRISPRFATGGADSTQVVRLSAASRFAEAGRSIMRLDMSFKVSEIARSISAAPAPTPVPPPQPLSESRAMTKSTSSTHLPKTFATKKRDSRQERARRRALLRASWELPGEANLGYLNREPYSLATIMLERWRPLSTYVRTLKTNVEQKEHLPASAHEIELMYALDDTDSSSMRFQSQELFRQQQAIKKQEEARRELLQLKTRLAKEMQTLFPKQIRSALDDDDPSLNWRCGCCEHAFPIETLEGLATYRQILDFRQRHPRSPAVPAPVKLDESAPERTVLLCAFCTQLFRVSLVPTGVAEGVPERPASRINDTIDNFLYPDEMPHGIPAALVDYDDEWD